MRRSTTRRTPGLAAAVAVAGTWSDLLIVREGKNNDAEAFPVSHRFAYRETHTNTDLFDTLGDSAPGGEFVPS